MPKISFRENIIALPKLVIAITLSILLILLDSVGVFDEATGFFAIINDSIIADIKASIGGTSENYYLIRDKGKMGMEIDDLKEEIQILKSENISLQNKLKEYSLIANQNKFSNDQNFLTARIISYISDEFGMVVVNKGSKDGVKEGQGVILRNYAVGYIVAVSQRTSEVRLINSPQSEITGYSADNNAVGVVKGDVSKGIAMEDIPSSSIIKEGEIILSTGVGENFPKGYILGQVIGISPTNNQATKSAELSLLIDLKKLSEVFIILEL